MGQLGESFPIGKLCSLHYGKMWVCSHWDLMTWLHKKRSMIWNFYPAQLGTDSAMSAYIIYHHWVRFCMTHSTRISPPFSFLSIIIHFAFPCLWEVCSLLNKIQNNVDVFVHQRPVLWNICYEYNVWVCLGQGKAHTLGFMSSGYTFGVWTMEVCSCGDMMMNVQGFLCMQVGMDSSYCLSLQPHSHTVLPRLRPLSFVWLDVPIGNYLWKRQVNCCQNWTAHWQQLISQGFSASFFAQYSLEGYLG